MKARNSSGEDYDCKHEWNCFVQCGGSGVVFSKTGAYRTAFFEAFPNVPVKCFIRGEGESIEEAEKNAWEKYQKIISCDHKMERRTRTDGYGYCKHCSYSSMVFEPLTKCCKCKIPTNYGTDYKGKMYCKKHHKVRPKNPDPKSRNGLFGELFTHRRPRKYKKLLKEAAAIKFKEIGYTTSIKYSVSCVDSVKLTCQDKVITLHFTGQFTSLLKCLTKK
jgi:hypothetical protein